MSTTKRRARILMLVVASVGLGASGATLWLKFSEQRQLNVMLQRHATLDARDCALLTATQMAAYAVRRQPDMPCQSGTAFNTSE